LLVCLGVVAWVAPVVFVATAAAWFFLVLAPVAGLGLLVWERIR
jgi:hypothetical protein